MNVLVGAVVTIGLTAVGSRYAYLDLVGRLHRRAPRRRVRTVLDVETPEDVDTLVRHVTHNKSTIGGDELAERLFHIYKRFPPKEQDMRTMCRLYELTRGAGTSEECACTLLYGVTTDVIRNKSVGNESRPPEVRRARSLCRPATRRKAKQCYSRP